ncbi:LysR family transcriptional regulator [Pseudogemmobacter faecipullorum]|uniref:LysR family transcriptional regulator n=1 Tax=Pseudogemmobacter faecipullorum TaxID=2755041 RepID=A0ABS8CMJ8_9RHOB|nr:LysR family transcriptional regulator [Pseudogemmobacter faecipullorum]MCB5410620.1 LysR family transcriptional regulator [Pseudogemmobacter faecipullorum]
MDITVLQTYLHVVEEGSFAAAARRMGISKSMSSKYISDLETSLGVRLLSRTTRSVRATSAGEEYYDRLRPILAELEQANEAMRRKSDQPSGRLRIGAPISYTLKVLNPLMMRFMEAYPEVQLDLMLVDICTDLVASGYDAVIRIGELEDSSLIARHLHDVEGMIVASPAYLAEYGAPQTPADLPGHRCLHYSHMRGPGTWRFRRGDEVISQKVQPVLSANSGDLLRAASLEGKGLAPVLSFDVADELADGRLVQILPDYSFADLPVNLVYPSGVHKTAALKVFIDFISQNRMPARLAA